jgi:predicted dehydrogenase
MVQRNLAIIGYGWVGRWHHKNLTEKIPGIKVVGAYDIRDDAFNNDNRPVSPDFRVYRTADELINDPVIDIAVIATPNDSHKNYAIQALRANKTVICEKPVTMNAAELEEIIAAARETGRLFSIHHNRRWDRDFRIIKAIYDEGNFGLPYFIESRVQGSRKAMHGWRGYKVNGGGMVLDWGVHLIDQLMWMVDSAVTQVNSDLLNIFSPEAEDNIKIFLRFENGISALLEMSTNCLINNPRWHVSFKDGTVTVNGWDCTGKIMKLCPDTDEMKWTEDIVYTEAGPTRTMAPRPLHTMQEMPLPTVNCTWTDYYLNILDVMDGKAELIVTPQQALRVMKVIDAVFESHANGIGVKCYI